MKQKLVRSSSEETLFMLIGKDHNPDKPLIAFLEDVLMNEEIPSRAIKLLIYMIDKANWESSEVWIDPKEAMQKLNIGRSTFYTWLKALIKAGYIRKLRPNRYKLQTRKVIVKDAELMDFG